MFINIFKYKIKLHFKLLFLKFLYRDVRRGFSEPSDIVLEDPENEAWVTLTMLPTLFYHRQIRLSSRAAHAPCGGAKNSLPLAQAHN